MKRISINKHREFLDFLLTPADFDDLDEMIQRDPYENFHGRRSDKEISKTLAILDELENEREGGLE